MPTNLNVIAVIDDDEVFQILFKKMIEREKAADVVLQFSDAFAGLSFFKNNATDVAQLPFVIVLDLLMPEMNGWQFLTQLDALQFTSAYTPSVFIVSGSENIDFEKMRNYPAIKGYITKPVIPNKLISLIASAKADS